jgi:hypothetical protein
MIVLALAAILGKVRGNRELKKLEPELRQGDSGSGRANSSGSLAIFAAIRPDVRRAWSQIQPRATKQHTGRKSA